MRKAHYWRKAGPSGAPSNLIFVDVETWAGEKARVQGGEYHTLRLGCALAYRLEHSGRTRIQKLEFTKREPFWELVRSRLDSNRPLWIFAHNANYDLGILNAWDVICGPNYQTNKAAMSNTMVWIDGQLDGKACIFCDTMNYYHSSLKAVGKSVGLPKIDIDFDTCTDKELNTYCWNDVEITALSIDRLIEFIRREELGPWAPSIAGLAFTAYRSRFMDHKVLVHAEKDVLKVERAAYYGGIVATNYIGQVPASPVYEVDVCSMFPAMSLKWLPAKLLGSSERMGPHHLADLGKRLLICADVEIKTDAYPYPCRTERGTYYPVGEYRTALAHPELMHALKYGHVKYVHSVSWYTKEKLFARYMRHFIGMKSLYRKADPPNEAFATLCKYYGNSLYGKTGQESPVWREWNEGNLQLIEREHGLPDGSISLSPLPELYQREETYGWPEIPFALKVRNYWGIVEFQGTPQESRDSCPVIAACITSYARLFLRDCHAICGPRNWYYSDTDSIWCNGIGLGHLRACGLIDDDVIGKLSVVSTHQRMTVHGNKDYETDRVRKLKGIKLRARLLPDGRWEQEHFPSATSQLRDGPTGGLMIRTVAKRLARTVDRCRVGADGWTHPLVFPGDCPDV